MSFAVYVQCNLNIIEDQHIQFNRALDCRTKSFWSFHEVGKGDMRVREPHRTFVYVCVLISLNCHRICSSIHRGCGKHKILNFCPKRQFNSWTTQWKTQFLPYLKQAFLLMLPPFLALALFFWIPGPKIETLTWRKTKLLDCDTALHMATRENCTGPD